MKSLKNPRRAVAAFIGSLSLFLLPALPASAEPAQPFHFPEQCENFSGTTVCIEQQGVMKVQESSGGTTLYVGFIKYHSTVYNSGQLIFESNVTQHVNNVSRKGDSLVSVLHQKVEDTSGLGTCSSELHLVYAGGELRRDYFDITCE